jgi:predicted DNA-binding protein (UPF0251 family)
MDRVTRAYRKVQLRRVLTEQAFSQGLFPSIKIVSGNGEGKTNYINISVEELEALRVLLTEL